MLAARRNDVQKVDHLNRLIIIWNTLKVHNSTAHIQAYTGLYVDRPTDVKYA